MSYRRGLHGRSVALALLLVLFASGCALIQRVSVGPGGTQANAKSTEVSLSADGRFVAFASEATNLVPDDTNAVADVFVYDRTLGTTERVSVTSDGGQADKASSEPSISDDGRYAAFTTVAVLEGPSTPSRQVYRHDRQTGETARVSVGQTVDNVASSDSPSISGDGSLVAFSTVGSDDPPPGESRDRHRDIWLRDVNAGTTTRVSAELPPGIGLADPLFPALSADGSTVAYIVQDLQIDDADVATVGPIPGIVSHPSTVRIFDVATNTTETIPALPNPSNPANRHNLAPAINGDGRFVVFTSWSRAQTDGGINDATRVYRYDRVLQTTTVVSDAADGVTTWPVSLSESVDEDARRIAYAVIHFDDSEITNPQLWIHDTVTGQSAPLSVQPVLGPPNGGITGLAVSRDGSTTAFGSAASNLVLGDTNGVSDSFVRAFAPTIDGVEASSLPLGVTDRPLIVHGAGFRSGAAVTIDGSGVAVGDVTVLDSTMLRVEHAVAPDAPLGPRSLTVIQDTGRTTCADCVNVIEPAARPCEDERDGIEFAIEWMRAATFEYPETFADLKGVFLAEWPTLAWDITVPYDLTSLEGDGCPEIHPPPPPPNPCARERSQVLSAIEAYRASEGHYPATIDELVGTWLRDAPTFPYTYDPLTGDLEFDCPPPT